MLFTDKQTRIKAVPSATGDGRELYHGRKLLELHCRNIRISTYIYGYFAANFPYFSGTGYVYAGEHCNVGPRFVIPSICGYKRVPAGFAHPPHGRCPVGMTQGLVSIGIHG